MQFRGNAEHTIDDRGRLAIAAKWRPGFPGNTAVIIPSPDGCLQVLPEPEFQKLSEQYATSDATTLAGRRARRLFDAQAFDAELDRQGRLLIPASLRQLAALDGNVIVVGSRELLEVWNPGRWREEMVQVTETSPDGQRSEE
jgi:MraZ protein